MKTIHGVQSLDSSHGGLAAAVADLCAQLEGAVILEGNPHSSETETGDLIHQHGLWTSGMRTLAAAARKRDVPLVISPHGMLEPWALSHRRWKKEVGMLLFQRRILKQAAAFHATSGAESDHIRALGFSQPIAVLPNGVPEGWQPEFSTKNEGVKTAVFLSRLDVKKGLPLLLDAWGKLQPEGWRLKIYGSGDAGNLPAEIKNRGLAEFVSFCGAAFGEEKWKALGAADLFVLPSFSENFGIVIVEAMEAGLPVITTTGTPWKMLEDAGCGWWVEPTVEGISAALEDAVSRTGLESMGEIGRGLVDEHFHWSAIAPRMTAFYKWILHGGERPSFVLE